MFLMPLLSLSAQDKVGNSHAEGRMEFRKQKNEQKKVFLQNEMKMTETEKVAFFALYDDFNTKMNDSRRRERMAHKELDENSADADYERVLQKITTEIKSRNELMDSFDMSMKKILPAKKVYLFYQAQHKYKRLLVKEMKAGEVKKTH